MRSDTANSLFTRIISNPLTADPARADMAARMTLRGNTSSDLSIMTGLKGSAGRLAGTGLEHQRAMVDR